MTRKSTMHAALAGCLAALLLITNPASLGAQCPVGPGPEATCNGDINGDGGVDIGDAVAILGYLFSGGPAPVGIAQDPCLFDCDTLFDNIQNASGVCDTTGPQAFCMMVCDPGFFDLNEAAVDGCEFAPDIHGVYVATTIGSDTVGSGTWDLPCASIGYGIETAVLDGRTTVYVADGLYEEPVFIVAGVSLLGGYDPETWERHLESSRTIIRPLGVEKAVVAIDIQVPTTLQGFVIDGADVDFSGASSTAVYVRDCDDNLAIVGNTIVGGRGSAGVSGSNGVDGQSGVAGSAGVDAFDLGGIGHSCTAADHSAGGAGGSLTCDGENVSGGAGGGRQCPQFSSGATVPPTSFAFGMNGNGAPGAPGGAGGAPGRDYFQEPVNCIAVIYATTPGSNGANGTGSSDGDGGPGAASGGSVVAGEWVVTSGAEGDTGSPGSGGGGGGSGAGGYVDLACQSTGHGDVVGPTGGGGGSGGCGGEGGLGGSSGGSSFALFIVFTSTPVSVPVVEENWIRGGRAGNGGHGGTGGRGGLGGAGGERGAGIALAFPSDAAGRGGDGGSGGDGGGGGGGAGGSCYGIHATGQGGIDLSSYLSVNTFVTGSAGAGGRGGPSLGSSGTDGVDGAALDANF